ncbi:nucleoside permease [soil metagenome]
MMLLEYAIWGAWAAVAGKYFTDPKPNGLGFPGAFSGLLFSLLPLGSILSPLAVGQLADRWMRGERLQGYLCLLCSGVLFALSRATGQMNVLWLMLIYALLFAPTTSLTNAIAFHHLKDPAKEFGKVRVGGTVGWFLALGCLSAWRHFAAAPVPGDLFMLAGVFSLLLGVYSFFLPATHPQHTSGGLPFIKALSLLKEPNFRVFAICSFTLGITLDFYYIFASAYLGTPRELGGIGASTQTVPLMMMLPQLSEMIFMSSLGWSLPKLGVKRALVIGFSGWIVRYLLLGLFPNYAAATSALLLHGIVITFVLVVGNLYVNDIAPTTIRSSAQALVAMGLFGLGRFVGAQLAGFVHDANTQAVSVTINGIDYHQQTNWFGMYSVPAVLAGFALVGLVLYFREPVKSNASP